MQEGGGGDVRGSAVIGGFVADVEASHLHAVDVEDHALATQQRDVDDERRLEPGELGLKNGGCPNIDLFPQIEDRVILIEREHASFPRPRGIVEIELLPLHGEFGGDGVLPERVGVGELRDGPFTPNKSG